MKKGLEKKYRDCVKNIKRCIKMANSTEDTNLKIFWLNAEQGFLTRAMKIESSK